MNKAIIIFSGFNQRAVVAFLRTISKTDIPFGVVAVSKDDTIFKTDYKKYVLATRDSKPLVLEDLLDKIKSVKNELHVKSCLIMPTAEALNRYFLEHRDTFRYIGCDMPVVEKDLYEKVSDKQSFLEICKSDAINVPGEYQDINDAPLPFVAKPKAFFAGDGNVYTPFIISSQDQKISFIRSHDKKDFTYQEFIYGKSLYLLYYFYKNGSVVKTSQINLAQQPGGKSIVAAKSTDFHGSAESEKFEKLFKSIGFRGLVMVEVKESGGKYYMIEANPRFWGPSQLFMDAGVNLFEDFLYDYGFTNQKPAHKSKNRQVDYFWYGGIHESGPLKNLAYHDYSEHELSSSLDTWLSNDVYNRKDTIELFKSELENN